MVTRSAKSPKASAAFAVRRIRTANPRAARAARHWHTRLTRFFALAILAVFAVSGLLLFGGFGQQLAAEFSLGGAGNIGGITIGGDVQFGATGLNGPGAQAGLSQFAYSYSGNKHGSAIGIITGWTNFVLPFVSVLAIAALVYAGFLYITAFGDEDATGKAKNIVIWVVIGIVIIISGYALVNTLLSGNAVT